MTEQIEDDFWAQERARDTAARGKQADPTACGTCRSLVAAGGQVEHDECAQRATLLPAPDAPGYELITGLSEDELAALPPRFHVPAYMESSTPQMWVCAVCWGEGWVTGWPCKTAVKHGLRVFTPEHEAETAAKKRAMRLAELEPQVDRLDHLDRITLPELRREIEHHQDGKARWRKRAETAEARVTELEAPASDEQLAEIQARATAATEGPWERYPEYGPTFFANTTGEHLRGVGDFNFGEGEQAEADEAFVRHAPEDVRTLLAEVQRLRGELTDQAEADTVAARAAQAISDMGADVRTATKERDRYRRAWKSAQRRTAAVRAELAKYVGHEPTIAEGMAYLSNSLDAVHGLCHETRRSGALGVTPEAVEQAASGEWTAATPRPALPWAAVMDDSELSLFLDDLVSAALGRWQTDAAGPIPDRDTLAAIEQACQDWRTPGHGLRGDEPEAKR